VSRRFLLLPTGVALAFFLTARGQAQQDEAAMSPSFVGYLSKDAEWRLPHLPHGTPDLLFASYRGGKPYSFIPSKR